MFAVSCEDRNPVAPTSSATLDQFVQALRQQGLTVSLGGAISPEVNRFFSVPAQQVRANDAQMNAFVYPTEQAAAAEAAAISENGQPSATTQVTWVSTPLFQAGLFDRAVRRCSAEIIDALQVAVGAPLAVGSTPCRPAGS
ncbi:MAG: hypothetical protein ACRD15_02755 [Vicinamibacterales bacterium]